MSLSPDHRFQRIPRERISERVAAELLSLIAGGEIRPGERLPGERQLAFLMNVSRVSVRAALQRLKAQGFVSAVQGGGTRVLASGAAPDAPLVELVRLSRENLRDLAEIRASLEIWAARRAAQHATPAQIREIESVLAMMADPRRKETSKAEDDIRFHFAIAKATGSTVYMHLLGAIRDILSEMLVFHRSKLADTPADDRRILAQHRRIFEAIRDRDQEAAGGAMRAHLEWVLAQYDSDERAAHGRAARSDSAFARAAVHAPPPGRASRRRKSRAGAAKSLAAKKNAD
ncbi:MAG: FadR/GntR family transcriptional regulator [Alphaproteobacteria bacterium]